MIERTITMNRMIDRKNDGQKELYNDGWKEQWIKRMTERTMDRKNDDRKNDNNGQKEQMERTIK